jgi:hypothetical protein
MKNKQRLDAFGKQVLGVVEVSGKLVNPVLMKKDQWYFWVAEQDTRCKKCTSHSPLFLMQ